MDKHELVNAEDLFQQNWQKAEEMAKNPDMIDDLLKKLAKKLQEVPSLGEGLSYIPKMGMLLNHWIKGEYKDIPIASIVAIIVVLVYFVSPVDLIPDIIPVVGYLDDAAVCTFGLTMMKSDIDDYMAWRKSKGYDKE